MVQLQAAAVFCRRHTTGMAAQNKRLSGAFESPNFHICASRQAAHILWVIVKMALAENLQPIIDFATRIDCHGRMIVVSLAVGQTNN